uniref:PH domain-containing protein n=1 Tax=Roseihalotalea indica TaxID=2867963 RepID=A0AA49JFM5_9BACT|nr:hypothetical protein K4G66_22895 [Tunicatimonas sp. TK19036]
MNEVRLYKSPWKAIRLFALTIPFVAIGILMITTSDSYSFNYFIGWLSVSFFGLGIPIGLFHLLDRRPQIIIDQFGVFDRTTNQETINWEIIEDAYLSNVHGEKFICLVVNEKYEPSKKKGKWYKRAAKFNKALGFQELNISLGQLKIDEEKLTEFIIAMSRADSAKRKEIIKTVPNKAQPSA